MKNIFWQKGSIVLVPLALSACGQGGSEIGAPQVTPPLSEALPTSLRSTAALRVLPKGQSLAMVGGMTCGGTESNIQEAVYQRLFCDGPTKILSLTDSIDSRMAEINTRAQESEKTCLSGDNVDKSSLLAFPAQLESNVFSQKYKCKDIFGDGDGLMAFGNNETNWWLLESGQGDGTTSSGISQAWRVTLADDGTVASEEAYITIAPKVSSGSATLAGSSMLLHLLVDTTAGTVEATTAGGSIGFKHVHFRSNATHVYVSGVRDGQTSTEEVCLNASDLSVASGGVTDCQSLEEGLALTALGRQAYSAGGLDASGAQNVDMSALADFILGETDLSDISAF